MYSIFRVLLLVILFSFSHDIICQCSALRFGGVGMDYAQASDYDDSGYLYVAGGFSNTVDFDPGPDSLKLTAQGSFDIFVSKFNSSGKLLWTITMGGTGANIGVKSIWIDERFKIYLVGSILGTCDFDPNPSKSFSLTSSGTGSSGTGGSSAFAVKLNNSGQFVWAKSIAATVDVTAYKVIVDKNRFVYFCGAFEGTADFDPGLGVVKYTSNGLSDGYICKLDSNGNYVWVIPMGGASMDFPRSIAFDPKHNIVCTGSFGTTVDFDPDNSKTFNLTSAGNLDIFTCKYSSKGQLIWAKSIGSKKSSDNGYAITCDYTGNILISGSFSTDTVDFDPGPGKYYLDAQKEGTCYIAKLDSNGIFKWAKAIGGAGGIGESCTPSVIVSDDSGYVYTYGNFTMGGDFNPGSGYFSLSSRNNGIDVFISKLSPNGDFVFAKQVGGIEADWAGDIQLDSKGNILIVGYFRGTADLDPEDGIYNQTSAGLSDAFIIKYTGELAPIITASGSLIFCQGDSLKLTSSVLKNNLWSTKDTTRSIWVKKTGNYTATVESGTCNRLSNSLKVNVLNRPAVPTISANRTEFCKGDSAILTSSYISGNLWSTGETKRSISVAKSGSYTVTYSDANNCKSTSIARDITANDTPSTPIISANGPTTFCDGGKVTITSSQLYGNFWSDGDTNRSRSIDYSQQLSVTATRGKCSKSSALIKIVVISYPPVPYISASGNSEFCVGDSVKLISSANSGNKWSTGETAKEIVVKKTGKYQVSVSNGSCSRTSDTFFTNAIPFPTFTKNPSNISVNQGGSGVFEVNTTASNPIYQWQIYQAGNYQNLLNNAQYSGVETSKLTISNVSSAINNSKFRCLVTEIECSSISATAVLTVNAISQSITSAKSPEFVIFPNPTQGPIYIDSKININQSDYIVHDIAGRCIKHGKIERDRAFGLINISEFPAGMYQIKFGDSFQYFARIIKD